MPPLRERREDIPLLVEHVRRNLKAQYGLSVAGVTRGALEMLVSHPWPGNVRELEAVLEQAMILQRGGWVGAEDIELPRGRSERYAPPRSSVVRPTGVRDERLGAAIRHQTALRIVAKRGAVTSGELAGECDISGEQARRELVALSRLGQLRRVGGGRSTRYVLA